MPLDASLEARQVGVEATYKDSRIGAVRFLPQRVFVVAQGESGVSFSTTKFTAQSANHVGQVAGYRSPAYLAARELLPVNGDGVGTVPVTFALLEDADGSSASTGEFTPSGTATRTLEFRANINEILGRAFAILTTDSISAMCVKLADSINDTLGMPGTATFDYGSATSEKTITIGTSNGTMGAVTIDPADQPRPGVYTLVCTAEASDAGTFSVTDPDGVSLPNLTVAVAYDSGTGLTFTLADGAEDFDVGDTFEITVPATKVNFVSGWKGASANAIDIRVDGPTDGGITWAYTVPTGGSVNPTVDDALTQVGNVWESMVLNALNISDTTALDTFQTWGEGRWSPIVKKPAVVFTGADVTTVASAIAIPDARKTDKINSQLVAPGSRNLPFVIAARQLARIARLANNNPPHDYALQKATGLVPGADGIQWDLEARAQAVKGGSSTVEIIDGVVNLSNIVTFYHPTGEEPPAYRYVVDIVKLQNVIYNVNLAFEQAEWAGAPLVPDNQLVTNPTAKKPKMAKAVMGGILQNLGLLAILSDPTTAAKNTSATIDTSNPKRLNIRSPIQLAGNTNIVDASIEWSFFFGQAPIVG